MNEDIKNSEPRKMGIKTFLDFFMRVTKNEALGIRFCFIIGAGASKKSGIPTGAELAQKWLDELHERYEEAELEQWALGLSNHGQQKKVLEWLKKGNAARYYPQIYDKRFGIESDEGYGYLEKIMEGMEPSVGYSMLAQIIANTQHNLVITTNFDSLLEDALFIYTRKRPLMCGHEALAGYIRPMMRRPIIAKIHRDLLLDPKNNPVAISELEDAWKKSLSNLFKFYRPIFVGYGGNDGSLMGFLEKIDPIKGGMIWCYRKDDGKPSERIRALVKKHNGFLVPIVGFDELMVQLNDKLGYPLMIDDILEIAKQKVENFKTQVKAIQLELSKSPEKADIKESLDSTIKSTIEKQKGEWWPVELMALSEDDPARKERIYIQGLKDLPKSAELRGIYALFLEEKNNGIENAEELYKKAIELAKGQNQGYAGYLNDYGRFLENRKKNYDEAEEKYNQSIELAPNEANYLNNYALFLANKRQNNAEAEKYFKRAIEANPKEPEFLCNYARLLLIQGKKSESKICIDKAISLNPANDNLLLELWFYRYALFPEWREDARREINILRQKGARLSRENMIPVIEITEKEGHLDARQLNELFETIATKKEKSGAPPPQKHKNKKEAGKK